MKKPKNSIADLLVKAEELRKGLEELKKATDTLFMTKGKDA